MAEKIENITFGSAAGPDAEKPVGIALTERQILCGDIGMKIAPDGDWYYRGSRITRRSLVQLFASVLRRDEDGAYWLITPAEVAPVEVPDTPFVIVEMQTRTENGQSTVSFRTNVDTWIDLNAAHALRVDTETSTGAPRPYVQVHEDGTQARLLRNVFYELVESAEETDINGDIHLMIESAGCRFILGPTQEDS